MINKDGGDIIHWHETIKESQANKKSRKQKIIKGFSVAHDDDLNIDQINTEGVLASKLRDTLEIIGIIQSDIKNGVQIMDNTGRAVISARDDEYGLKSSTIMLADHPISY